MSAPRERSKTRALMSVALMMLINASIQLTQLSAQSHHHHHLMSNNKTQITTSDSLQAAPSSQPKHLLQPSGGSQQLRNQQQQQFNQNNDDEALLASANQPAAVEVDVTGDDSTSGPSDTPDSASTTSSSDELDGDEEPTGSGDVPVASDEDDSHSASSSSGTTEASQYEAVHLRPSRQSHVITQQQPPTTTTTPTTTTLRAIVASRQPPTALRGPPAPASGVALDVNMGADLMLIKPAITWADSSSTTTTSSTPPLMSDEIDRRNLAAFQARHNQLVNKNKQQSVDLFNSLASSPVPLRTTTTGELAVESVNHQQVQRPPPAGDQVQINERRQDLLLYPHHHNQNSFQGGENLPAETLNSQQMFNANVNMPHTSSNSEHHSACYTPVSLISVILITMLITIALCLGARQLFKYLSRHQFDLVENSKHFQPTTTTTSNSKRTAANCSLHLFQHDAQCQKCQFNQTASTTNPRCQAFRNPYFTEGGGSLITQQQQQQQPVGLLKTTGANPDEQMNFIESHIANLHSRQVTSSVKELSSLSGHPLTALPPTTPQVVDLTSREHRARILANPRQGDLISVDISGHDIIGLGFDLCGNQRDGIFVRSVQSRGPARESGAIQPGDRLKCLNVSFEQVTLQDACDLLNSAAPYKMRLLIEKKVASGLELKQLAGGGGGSSKSSDMLDSPLDATRAYLRKLTGKLTGGSSNTSSSSSTDFNGESSLVTSGSPSPANGAQQQPPPVGSAGARALRHSRRALRNAAPESGGSHVNEAFNLGSADSDDAIAGGGVEIAQHVRKHSRKQSTSSRRSTTTTTTATHKLRGPPMASEAVIDLRQLGARDDQEDSKGHISPRRQSVDTTTTTTPTTSRLMNVERSMSQGQLANNLTSSDSVNAMTNNDDHGQ